MGLQNFMDIGSSNNDVTKRVDSATITPSLTVQDSEKSDPFRFRKFIVSS